MTIVLARSGEDMEESSAVFERAGFTVQKAPVLRIAPPESWDEVDQALRELDQFDGLVCTSANGLRMLENRVRISGKSVRDRVIEMPTYVAGGPSAEVGRKLGFRTVLLPDVVDGVSLAAAMVRTVEKSSKILQVRGDRADRMLNDILTAEGFDVRDVIAYRTTVAAPIVCERIGTECRSSSADVVLFFSPSSVEGLIACVGESWIRERKTIAIGQRTAAALTAKDIAVAFVPSAPSVDEVASYLQADEHHRY